MPVTNPPRNYLQAGGPPVIATQWLFDKTGVTDNGGGQGVTGYWRPVTSDDFGIDSITFSGINVNLGDVESAIASGNASMAFMTGAYAVAFPTGYNAQTGQKVIGPAVVVSGFNPQYPSGQNAAFAFDNINGGGLVEITDLDRATDSVLAYSPPYTSTSNYVFSGNASTYAMVTGNVFPAVDPNRVQNFIQNIGSGTLFVKLGAAPCGTGSFSMLLKGASSTFGTDGGIWSDGAWQGVVSVSGQTIFQAWTA